MSSLPEIFSPDGPLAQAIGGYRVRQQQVEMAERIAAGMPVFGTCAGMILLATEILDAGVAGRAALPLRGIDMTVRRNAFGRQVDSFEDDLDFVGLDDPVHAVFIRAPWVERVGPDVEVLASAAKAASTSLAG